MYPVILRSFFWAALIAAKRVKRYVIQIFRLLQISVCVSLPLPFLYQEKTLLQESRADPADLFLQGLEAFK